MSREGATAGLGGCYSAAMGPAGGIVRFMRNEEIMQRAIGVLTLMHGGDGEADDLRLALKLLQEDVFSYSVAVPDSATEDVAEFVRLALEQVMARVAAIGRASCRERV